MDRKLRIPKETLLWIQHYPKFWTRLRQAQALNESVDEVSLIDSLNFSNGFQEFSEYGILQSLTVLQATI